MELKSELVILTRESSYWYLIYGLRPLPLVVAFSTWV
jgi:hypothetical protein